MITGKHDSSDKAVTISEGFPFEAFRKDLLRWWHSHMRQFPWRETGDPYKILIAEVLLHRTRADQVVSLYRTLLERFPSIKHLSSASPDELQTLLKPAGLHWRVRLLHVMANEITSKFGGQIPHEREELKSLPGISDYIASAVRCFAYGYPDVLLDTNTVRITGRLFELSVNDSSRRSKLFRNMLNVLLDPEHPREFNFALIDLGALVCRSHNPLCSDCPANRYCCYGKKKLQLRGGEG